MKAARTSDRLQEHKVSSSLGGRLAAMGMVVLMLAGLFLNVQRLLDNDVALSVVKNNLEQVLNGTASRDVAADLAQTSLPIAAAKLQRAANWLLLGDLGPKVRQGCPDWLFLTDEFIVHPNYVANSLARAATVKQVHDMLSAKRIKLVVAIVPDKSRIMAKQLCALERPSVLQARAAAWVASLRDAGTTAIDLTAVLQSSQETPFLRTDTHWNSAGAKLAAQALADEVKMLSASPLSPPQVTAMKILSVQRRPGDLVKLAGIDWLPELLQPATEHAPELEFDIVKPSDSNEHARSEDDLFGDSNLPSVALIGSSFSRTSNFSDFLGQALETPVANLAKDGGAFSGAAHAYFRSSAFKQTPPKVLIWEIPERDLQAPLTNELSVLPP